MEQDGNRYFNYLFLTAKYLSKTADTQATNAVQFYDAKIDHENILISYV